MKYLLFLFLTLPLLGAEYAKIEGGNVVQVREVPDSVNYSTTFDADKWKPVVRDPQPNHDPATQKLTQLVTIGDENVTFGWQVVPLTQEEQDRKAELQQRATEAQQLQNQLAAARRKLRDGTITNAEVRQILLFLLRDVD